MKTWLHGVLWIWIVGLSLGGKAKEMREISRQSIPGQSFQVLVQTETPVAQQLNQMMTLFVELVSHTKETEGAREKWKLIAFTAEMPAHKHGMVVAPTITAQGADKWKIFPVKLHMMGHWRLSFSFEKDNQTQVLFQDLQVK